MRILRRLNERFNSYLFDSSIYIKDRTFVLFTSLELMALLLNAVAAVILGDPLTSALASLMGVAVGAVILIILVRMDKIKVAKIAIALVLVLILRPAAFFAKGGVDNGTMVMMLLGSYYLIMILDGVFRIVICLIDTSLLVTCGVIAYHHPEYLTAYYRKSNYTKSFVQYINNILCYRLFLYIKDCRFYDSLLKLTDHFFFLVFLTIIVHLAFLPFLVLTVITALPTFLAVTTPLLLTLATFLFEEVNVTVLTVALVGLYVTLIVAFFFKFKVRRE